MLEGGFFSGEISRGRSESRSRLRRLDRKASAAKQITKIPARQELTRMVTARTFTAGVKRLEEFTAPHYLAMTERILSESFPGFGQTYQKSAASVQPDAHLAHRTMVLSEP